SAFSILSQSGERPERWGESFLFETMPSRPSLQACRNTVSPSPSMCSLKRIKSGRLTDVRPVHPECHPGVLGGSSAALTPPTRRRGIHASRPCGILYIAPSADLLKNASSLLKSATAAARAYPRVILAGNDPKPVVFDLVQPFAA